MFTYEDWNKFWMDYEDDPENIEDIEGLIFKDKNGRWKMVVCVANDKPIVIQVYFNPFTGDKLE